MKNLFLAAAVVMLLAPAALSAQRTSSETHFAGERITGIDASSAFDIVLVKSNQTKAVVEVPSFYERYVQISRSAGGVVTIGLGNVSRAANREFNDLPEKDRIMKLTLYLPTLNTIRLSGATDLSATDIFPGEDVDIQLSGASDIDNGTGLRISSTRVKLQCSGACDALFVLDATTDLAAIISGASDVDIKAHGLNYSKLGVSGASDVYITGNGGRGDWTVSGSSDLRAVDFTANELSVKAGGASSAHVRATGSLTAEASGASSVRYAGRPASLNIVSDDVRPL
jgi:hypothetical protein